MGLLAIIGRCSFPLPPERGRGEELFPKGEVLLYDYVIRIPFLVVINWPYLVTSELICELTEEALWVLPAEAPHTVTMLMNT